MTTIKKSISAKKPIAKKVIARKAAPAKKAAAKHAPAARRPTITDKPIAGFTQQNEGILVPTIYAKPVVVSPNKLRDGLEAAQGQIKKTLQGFAAIFTEEFEVSEIELTLSFNAEGKFLGFGAGGEMSVSVKIVPCDA